MLDIDKLRMVVDFKCFIERLKMGRLYLRIFGKEVFLYIVIVVKFLIVKN